MDDLAQSTALVATIFSEVSIELLSSRWRARFVRAEKEFTIKHD
jgi:hypothetical protein